MAGKNQNWIIPEWEDADAVAIRCLLEGTADADQQRRGMRWIIEKCCGTYDMAFRPGQEGQRNTDFCLGRQFVGQQIIALPKKFMIVKTARRTK